MNKRPILQIAYADDHPVARKGVSLFIEELEEGFKVYIQAENGQELLDKIAKAAQLPDVCILDISMPVMNGYETIVQLKEKYPTVPVLVLTALDYGTEYPVLKMMQNGAGGYLNKNVDPDEIGAALVAIYSTGYYFSKKLLSKFPGINEKSIKEYAKKIFNERETEFLSLCCSDMTYEDIAEKMNISKRTAENYAGIIGREINIHSRAGLAMYALCAGIGRFNFAGGELDAAF